jgi:hypothetical protein
MGSNLDLFLNEEKPVLNLGGSFDGSFPTLYRNDVTTVNLRVQKNVNGTFIDSTLNSPTFSLGIGDLDKEPTAGEFKLFIGAVTSTAIPYNATTTQVLNAVSGVVGSVSVATFGSDGSAWVITAVTNNTAMSFGGLPFTLFPETNVLISTRRSPASDIKAEQIVQLRQSPLVSVTSFSNASTANAVTLALVQNGSPTQNETYRLSITDMAQGGSFSLVYATNSTTGIQIFDGGTSQDSATIQAKLGAVTGIGLNNISVVGNSVNNSYIISFVNGLGLTNLTTALTLDAGGVEFTKLYTGTLTLGSAGIEKKFTESSATLAELTLEIEMTEANKKTTMLQRKVNVSRDLIANP